MEKEKERLTTIKYRKIEYMGHIMKNNQWYKIPQLILKKKSKEKEVWEEHTEYLGCRMFVTGIITSM